MTSGPHGERRPARKKRAPKDPDLATMEAREDRYERDLRMSGQEKPE